MMRTETRDVMEEAEEGRERTRRRVARVSAVRMLRRQPGCRVPGLGCCLTAAHTVPSSSPWAMVTWKVEQIKKLGIRKTQEL